MATLREMKVLTLIDPKLLGDHNEKKEHKLDSVEKFAENNIRRNVYCSGQSREVVWRLRYPQNEHLHNNNMILEELTRKRKFQEVC